MTADFGSTSAPYRRPRRRDALPGAGEGGTGGQTTGAADRYVCGPLFVLDFDGTITEADVLDVLAQPWDRERWLVTERVIANGGISAAQALARELSAVRCSENEAMQFLISRSVLRPGSARLVADCTTRAWDVIVLSDGIAAYARAVLEAARISLPVYGHEVNFRETGAAVRVGHLPCCSACGTQCKRPRMDVLAACRPVLYVGDGLSDLCAARGAASSGRRPHW